MRALGLLALVLLAGAAAAGALALVQREDQRSLRYFPDMAKSAAYRAQTPNRWFAQHQTQLAPVPGTLARGVERLAEDPSVHGYMRAGIELHGPFGPEHPADLQRGRAVFETYCMVCHGPKAEGNGPAVQHGFPRPPSLLFGKALNMQDGHIFHIITNGFRHMPSYGSQIEPADRWQAVAYVRSLQEGGP